jgi:phosphoribosylformylglycinamidine (FGAM) synthase-like enzyme
MVPVHRKEGAWYPVEFDAAVRTAVTEQPQGAVASQGDHAAAIAVVDPPAGAFLQFAEDRQRI